MQFKVQLSVKVTKVWPEPERTQEVEILLEETFTPNQLSIVGSSLQRGAYDALERAVRVLETA